MSISLRVGALVGSLVMLAASIGIVVAGPASADVVSVTVTSNGDAGGSCPSVTDCTLRQALSDANSTGSNGAVDVTISFAPGLDPIQLVSTLDYDGGVGGAHVLTLIGNGVTLSGNQTFALLANYTTSSFFIEGVNFTDGGGGTGGAIVTPNASSNLVVRDSSFSDNRVTDAGGAVYAIGSVEFSNVTFTDNIGDVGGAVYAVGSARFTDSTFMENSSNFDGGALKVHGSMHLESSTLAGNRSVHGEGAFWADGVATIVNSTLVANVGGALASTVSADDLVLAYSTITDVHVADGQMALVARSNRFSAFASVIAGAEDLSGGMLCNVAATSFGYNVTTDSSCGLTGTGDIQDATVGAIDLGPLIDNGGLTSTQLPRIASPLVAAIPHAACATGPAADVTTDQRGYARPNVAGGSCDIGAVQLTPAVSATVTGSMVAIEVREFTSTATITLYSDPELLGTIAVDATGFGRATFALPASVMCGVHDVVATASEGQLASTQLLIGSCIAPVFTG